MIPKVLPQIDKHGHSNHTNKEAAANFNSFLTQTDMYLPPIIFLPELEEINNYSRTRLRLCPCRRGILSKTSNLSNIKIQFIYHHSLVQCGHSLSCLDLIQAKSEGKPTGQFLNSTNMGRCPVQIRTLLLNKLIEQLEKEYSC